jgi:D-alanyl-lipoteichoic acid acyltransferase DltB (MBOAT superfamily)
LAGPIGRASKMLPQFSEKYDFDPERVKNGFILIIWGFFKKLVIADRLVVLVDTVYNDPTNYSGWALIIATYFFAVQIYCDFSGYSNIAIGVAKVLGYELPDNFNKPYFAQSIREFWRRWHITLYQWFRDYVYISLGGNRVKKWIMILNILMVFAVTGLWHGAAWTFIIWGMMHGLYMIGGMFWSWIVEKIKLLNRIKGTVVFKFVEILITFHLVVFAWIFFRANSTTDAFYVVSNIFRNLDSWQASGQLLNGVGISTFDLRVSVISILFMIIFHVLQRNYVRISDYISNLKVVSRWSFMYLLIMAVLLFGVFEKEVPFLYFRF